MNDDDKKFKFSKFRSKKFKQLTRIPFAIRKKHL